MAVINIIIKKYPLFLMQMATIWSQRMSIAVSVFGTVLALIVMSFSGWLDNTYDILHTCWVLLIIWLFVAQSLLIRGEKNRGDLFYSLGRITEYCRAEWLALFVSLMPMALICSGIVSLCHNSLTTWLYQFLMMAMVIIVSSHAMSCNLLPKLIQLPYSKRIALMIVISGPWIIPAWLLGMTGGEAILNGGSFLYPLLGILGLLVFQMILGLLLDDPHA